MVATRKSVGPFESLFAGSEAAKVIDFLLSQDQHQTVSTISASTYTSTNLVSKIIDELLDIDVIGIGARRVTDPGNIAKIKDENTFYIRDDTDTGKSIKDLWYHLMQVQTKSF
jgi:hypothetical protein